MKNKEAAFQYAIYQAVFVNIAVLLGLQSGNRI